MDDFKILIEFPGPDNGFSVVLDEECGVGYAYLRREGKLTSHVWLYNRSGTPDFPEWGAYREPPYKNSRGYVRDAALDPPNSEAEFSVVWSSSEEAVCVDVLLRGQTIGRLLSTERVGWSLLAVKAGPLAKPLVES